MKSLFKLTVRIFAVIVLSAFVSACGTSSPVVSSGFPSYSGAPASASAISGQVVAESIMDY